MKTIKSLILLYMLLLWGGSLYAQQVVRGVVTDATGSALPGVTVNIRGTQDGTTTDFGGNYALAVPSDTCHLIYTYVGFKDVTEPVKGRRMIHVTMEEDVKALEEVVVTSKKAERENKSLGYATYDMVEEEVVYEMAPSPNARVSFALTGPPNTESYEKVEETGYRSSLREPLSTFSADVDAASYSNMRRFLNQGNLPPHYAVRVEEMINYFDYDYAGPDSEHPFAVHMEQAVCPWAPDHKLVRIGVQGKDIKQESLPPSNLVFLLDVSGSMEDPDKLPLLKSAFRLLVNQLRPEDRVAIVVYAGAAGEVLPSTSGADKEKILDALERLNAGGSTAGGQGIRLAYDIAKKNFLKEGNNRIILATDGDFNIGESSNAAMHSLIEEKRKSGVFLTVLGFGTGNYKDDRMELLADKGNGNYAYIDNLLEAKKVLVNEMGGTLVTIAKDVKFQVEFNPAYVAGYRLIGYENRRLNNEDFNDDKKDAGDIGAGHNVTALYEIIPVGVRSDLIPEVDGLKYQKQGPAGEKNGELMNVKLRYKQPDGEKSVLLEQPLKDMRTPSFGRASDDFRWAAAVAEAGLLLSESEYAGEASFDHVLAVARSSRGRDHHNYRGEFISLMEMAKELHKDKKDLEARK